MENVDFNEVVKDAIKFLKHEKPDGHINIKHTFFSESFNIFLDKIQIQQVLINILRNAIEALHDTHIENPEVTIAYEIIDNKLVVTITDNGPGFPHTILLRENVMMSTKKEGMGVGLAICRSILEAHGGHLLLNNLNEGGAFVQLTIPFLDGPL